MRLAFNGPAGRLARRARRLDAWTLLQGALLVLIVVQGARLAWTLARPIDVPVTSRIEPTPVSTAVLGGFDPFFRLSGASGPAVVTSLNLKLFGVRQDQASGRGSAIIAGSDGKQKSVGVGEEVEPGVVLKAVEFDSVTISRNGRDEQLFMDQSKPASGEPASGAPPPVALPAILPVTVVPPAGSAAGDISASPRMTGRSVTGAVVGPRGSGEALRALGLAPGDVVISVNGRRIGSAQQAAGLGAAIGSGRGVVLQVERGGRVVTLRPGDRR
ncbi:MAG TPA: type II secretion system protein N [Allosphingosinicella sp.]|nr:type II secretion system protein N [Allosphingosinicella sp.]